MSYGTRSKGDLWLLKIDEVEHSFMECEGAELSKEKRIDKKFVVNLES